MGPKYTIDTVSVFVIHNNKNSFRLVINNLRIIRGR